MHQLIALPLCLLVSSISAVPGFTKESQESSKSENEPSIAISAPFLGKSSNGLPGTIELSPPAKQLAEQLGIFSTISELHAKQAELKANDDLKTLCQTIELRQKLYGALQYASVEVEEAVAAIDGDIAKSNMLLAYVSSKQERASNLNNIATFVGSGAFGVLDSSSSLRLGVPTPQILGIIGNSIAVGVPTFGLRRRSYAEPQKHAAEANMLAPIFNRPFDAESYDPLVWNFLNGTPAGANSQLTRRQLLLQQWRQYRNVDTTGSAASSERIDALVGIQKRGSKLTIDLVKTRSELLVDLRALIQLMYRDISELNSAIRQVAQ